MSDESTLGMERNTAERSEGMYLLVLEPESSWIYQLPSHGEVVIGRADGVEVRLKDAAVSRKHARITIHGGEARLADLGSHNGTQVNGETVDALRFLVSGDSITVCGVTLVFHSGARPVARRPLLDSLGIRQRADDEIARALRFERGVGIVFLVIEPGGDRRAVARALEAALRSVDSGGWHVGTELVVVRPEADREETRQAAAELVAALAPHAQGARAGYACCPSDGADLPSLLSAARTAARAAETGEARAASAARAGFTRRIGELEVVVADPAMVRLYALIERLAAVDELPVLIQGETGCGKELAATALHLGSARRDRALVTLNCAALPEHLVESELFGHARGAFTGAVERKGGLLESAGGGTLFLDEVGELPPAVQAKLLRVLESKSFMRVGEARPVEIDLRLVAATNRDLAADVKRGRFREDLYFRLSGATVCIPPLRDRRVELPPLCAALMAAACARAGRPAMEISDEAMRAMLLYRWPGNVRQLKHALTYVAAAFPDPVLRAAHLEAVLGDVEKPPEPVPDAPRFRPLDEEVRDLEKQRMAEALEAAGGNQTRAAQLLRMPVRTFFAKVKQYGLKKS